MSNTLRDALLFLINTLFDLYLFILIVRIILVWVKSDYFNPAVQFITKCTNFLIIPLRRFIPNFHRLETATVVLVLVLEMSKFLLISLLSYRTPALLGLILLAAADSLKLIIQTFFYAILLQAILSWVQPRSSINYLLYQFTSPIMRPIHRLVPPIGGIDISPIPALILLQLLIIVLVNPLMATALGTAFA